MARIWGPRENFRGLHITHIFVLSPFHFLVPILFCIVGRSYCTCDFIMNKALWGRDYRLRIMCNKSTLNNNRLLFLIVCELAGGWCPGSIWLHVAVSVSPILLQGSWDHPQVFFPRQGRRCKRASGSTWGILKPKFSTAHLISISFFWSKQIPRMSPKSRSGECPHLQWQTLQKYVSEGIEIGRVGNGGLLCNLS